MISLKTFTTAQLPNKVYKYDKSLKSKLVLFQGILIDLKMKKYINIIH